MEAIADTEGLVGYLRWAAGRHAGDHPSLAAGPYRSYEELVVDEARAFGASPVDPAAWRGLANECYRNARQAASALAPQGYVYAEGYAVPAGGSAFPIAHAWLVDPQGLAVEVTWPSDKADGAVFHGIEFDPAWVDQQHALTGRHSVLEQSGRFSLLSGGIPDEARPRRPGLSM